MVERLTPIYRIFPMTFLSKGIFLGYALPTSTTLSNHCLSEKNMYVVILTLGIHWSMVLYGFCSSHYSNYLLISLVLYWCLSNFANAEGSGNPPSRSNTLW